ncbi:beta-lactamase regulating signal transducer with metallopeptidase domain/archaellum component FlaC [Spirosoma lacussanchae]|uniref:M56 family metallopeptidase n=1 Tax=Spirosoma lacussanchae TaxID=1884249 RepID=UPI001109A609|nr:M56 family metallopeptidase [Spirosoma lacussanchae]
MNTTDWLNNPTTDALGWTLLHAIWQGFALVLPAALVLHGLRNRSSVLRYRVAVLTLLSQLLASAVTFWWYYTPAVPAAAALRPAYASPALSVRWQTATQTLPWHQQMQQFLDAHLSQFVLAYLIGVAVFAVRLAGGWLYLQRLSRTATRPMSSQVVELTQSLRAFMQIGPVIQVRESARVVVPMVVGVLKPVLLLPVSLTTSLSVQEVEAVLAHELAHVKRHDYAVNLVQSVVEVLYFFHPALWWLSARIREEREHCCDGLAVEAVGGNGRILAQALARVEELRLTQLATPTLAMAFASKRQHLLHRVRRVLGVPTRPMVSNGSLAGLTLATLLLVSASVYAVQQQPQKPKPKTAQAKTSRRHKADNGTEYGMTGNQRISYIVWKGQKLPAKRVAQLQRQLDLVMAGQFNLDDVRQPDRDILLTIIETNTGFDAGMNALTAGLAHIDYDNIVGSAMAAGQAGLDKATASMAAVDYGAVAGDMVASIDTNILIEADVELAGLANLSDAAQQRNSRQMDSLSQLMAQHARQMQALHLQMEKLRFPVEEAERNREVLQWKKDKLMDQRQALLEKHQQLLYNDSKQKLSQADVEKQLAALEPEIKKLESTMDQLSQQFEQASSRQEELKQPLEKLEKQAQQLERQIDLLSDQLVRHGDAVGGLTPPVPPAATGVRPLRGTARPARAPRVPLPPRAARPDPVDAPAPPARALAPARPEATPRPPGVAPKPAAAPKTPPVPRPDR